MYSKIFTQFVLGQKVTGMGWIEPTSDNNYVGGYYIQYENGYKTITRGGCRSGYDYTAMNILNEKGEVVEKHEDIN